MTVSIQFWSYFRDLTGTAVDTLEVAEGSTVGTVLDALYCRYPALQPLRASTLVAVGVEYADPQQVLRANEEVSLFPRSRVGRPRLDHSKLPRETFHHIDRSAD